MARLELYLTPRRNIIPATDHDVETVRRLPPSTVFSAYTHKPRNLAHHRKYRALLAFIAANHPEMTVDGHSFRPEPNDIAYMLKLRAGFGERRITPDGETYFVARSTAFDECDQIDFDRFYAHCLVDLFDYFYPQMPHEQRADFLAEALRFSA